MSLDMVLVWGPRKWHFLMSEVTLHKLVPGQRALPPRFKGLIQNLGFEVQGYLAHKKTPIPLELP